jgi:nucleotide-binding universal stress UspA family protein
VINLTNILVATDFGEAAGAALIYGGALARHFTATLHVVHVVGNVTSMAYGGAGPIATLPQIQREIEDAAREQLNGLTVDLEGARLPMRRILLASERPAEALAEYALEARVNLLVTGTHGRGVVGHLLLGSVAERIVRIAPCPVLTVRHPQQEFIVADGLVATAGV